MRRLYLILAAIIFILLLVCSKKSTGPEEEMTSYEILKASLALQDSVGQRVIDWIEQTDTVAAINSGYRALIKEDQLVDTAYITSQGIAIKFKNGMHGGIMIDAGDGLPLKIDYSGKLEDSMPSEKPVGNHPDIMSTLFLCPIYYERQELADSLISSAEAGFAKAGFNEFTKFLGSNCTLQKFRQLENFGLIHIYSHSFAWPDDEAMQEIYLMSGENAADIEDQTEKALEENQISIIYVPGHGNTYFLAPSYLNPENNLQYESPLIYLGFENSLNAKWQDRFLYGLHAGACIGFDWYVSADRNISWAEELYGIMGDTSQLSHITLNQWYSSIESSYNYDEEHTTNIKYFGPDDFYLWKKVKITDVIPQSGQAGDTIQIHGGGFEEDQNLGIVLIGLQEAHVVTWSDTLITAIVPSGTYENIIQVKIGNIYSNSVDFYIDYAIKIISIDPDTVHPGETVRISGFEFGDEQGEKVLHVGVFEPDPISWSDTLITVKIPEDVNAGEIYITYQDYVSNIYQIEIIRDMIITKVVPDSGTVIDTVSIHGKGFGETMAWVCFEHYCSNNHFLWTDTLILTKVHGSGLPVDTKIGVRSGSVVSNVYPFRIIPISTISSIIPETIMFGDTVKIRGDGFGSGSPDLRIIFGGSILDPPNQIISWSDSLIVLTAPDDCYSGEVYVFDKSKGHFYSNKYNIKVFGIRYLDPHFSQAGKYVRIIGSGFGDTQNGGSINYGSVNKWSDTLIGFKVPDDPTTREIFVTVGGVQSNARILKFPQIFSVNPLWAAPGQQVEIRGSDFGDTSYSVLFYNGYHGDVLSWEDSLIVATVSEEAHSGPITLRFPGSIRYSSPPLTVLRIEKLWPNYGLPGDTLEIHGTGFLTSDAGGYVTFNQIEAEVASWSDTLIETIVPVGAEDGEAHVHVNDQTSAGVDFYLASLGEIYELLHQGRYAVLSLEGVVTWRWSSNYTETRYEGFAILDYRREISWVLDSFQFGWFCDPASIRCDAVGVKGRLSTDGLSVVNVHGQNHGYWDVETVNETMVWNFEFTLVDVPFSHYEYHVYGDTIKVIYEVTGPEVQNHIQNMLIYKDWYYYDDGPPDPENSPPLWPNETHDVQVDSIDWQNEEHPPKIRVVFSNYAYNLHK